MARILCVGVLLPVVGGQDIFLPKLPSIIHDAPSTRKNATRYVHDGWVFSFSPSSEPTVCWDLPNGGSKGTLLQAWECNGLEGQLFYFDKGSNHIQTAGDASMCLDAGTGMKQGTQLKLWKCNGKPQQQFGYDSNTGEVNLLNSNQCVDLADGQTTSGTSLQLWECNGLPGQSFDIKSGITIRPNAADSKSCLDVAGGSAYNGAKVWLWECNGLMNQQWIFEESSYVLKWAGAGDTTFCLDGFGLNLNDDLQLWECNGFDQQKWGYNSDMGEIYTMAPYNEKLCLDLPGGSTALGVGIKLWECNGCWNQRWNVVGPVSGVASAYVSLPGACPPPPNPRSPTDVFMPDCSLAAPNWPVFNNANELSANAEWSSYFQTVYGDIPQAAYPICVGSFTQIKAGGIQHPVQQCDNSHKNDGVLVHHFSPFCDPLDTKKQSVASFIINSANIGHAIPKNHWAEIMHMSFDGDGDAAWYFLTFGSAIWWNVGETRVYRDHPDAAKEFLGIAPCTDRVEAGRSGTPTECEEDFDNFYPVAISQGLDSIQFTHHNDCSCGEKGPSSIEQNRRCTTEIIDLHGHGSTGGGCASKSYRAGWAASQECSCDGNVMYTNCRGFGI